MSVVDARGLSCPGPVLLTKKMLDKGGTDTVKVMVDEMAACENVSALAKSLGWQATYRRVSDYIEILLKR